MDVAFMSVSMTAARIMQLESTVHSCFQHFLRRHVRALERELDDQAFASSL